MVREKILEKYQSVSEYAHDTGIDELCLDKKLRGEMGWNIFDIEQFSDVFNVPVRDIKKYFGDFVPKSGTFRERLLKYFGTVSGACDYIGCECRQLQGLLWNGQYLSGDIVEPICNILEIVADDFFEKEETLIPIFFRSGCIKQDDMPVLAKKMNIPPTTFGERVEGYTKWKANEIEKLKEILNIKRLSDFIDESGFSKTEIVYEYKLPKQEKREGDCVKSDGYTVRYIDGVKHARFSAVYDPDNKTVVNGYEDDFLSEFLYDIEQFCISVLWGNDLLKKRLKASNYESFLKHIYVQCIPIVKQKWMCGELTWKCIAVK